MENLRLRQRDITFAATGEALAGRFVLPELADQKRGVVFLHGAGKATKERAMPLALKLASYGIASFLFDFSGHGASSGTLERSSLRKRVDEAQAALAQSGFEEPYCLCAFSMGGHVALEVLKSFSIGSLFLFYPAVYGDAAVDIPFGNPRFSETIRQPRSWAGASVFTYLRSFTGDLLIVSGEHDQIIPPEIPDLFMLNSPRARTKRLIKIEGAPHLLLPVLFERPALFEEVSRLMVESVRE